MESLVGSPIRVLHAGFHKTGSTFLQRRVFPNLPDTWYLGAPSLKEPKSAHHPAAPKLLLLSSEAACGFPYPLAERFSTATLLANVRLFSISKVFVIQRELSSWAASLYFQTLNEGHWWTPEEFIHANREALLTWNDATKQLAQDLAEEGVEFQCYSHEEMSQNLQGTVDRITDFLEVGRISVSNEPINPSYYGGRTIWAYRKLNRLSALPGLRQAGRVFSISPRRMMQKQRGAMAAWLESSSRLRLDHLDL